MFDHWLDILQRGNYDLALPTLTITRGTAIHCQGSGWLTWQQGSGLVLRATTNGVNALFAAMADDHEVGQLLPRESFLSVSGTSQDEWCVNLTQVPLDGYHIHGPSPHVVWNLSSPGVTLSRPARRRGKNRKLHALFGPPPETWVRGTETEVRHPDFGRRIGALDWLEATTSAGRVVVRKRTDDWCEVVVYLSEAAVTRNAFDVLNAVGRAFSFVLGRRVHLRGYEDFTPETDIRYLYAAEIRPTRNGLYQPLGRSDVFRTSIEPLLGLAINFFLTERGTQVARHMHLCWDTADNDIQTQMSTASIVAEGLLLLATSRAQPPDPGFTPQDREAASRWLRENEQTLSPRFVARVRGLLGTLNHRRPIDVLQDWRQRSVLCVTQDDVEAWRELRNSTAHARLVEPGGNRQQFQTRLDYLRRVLNLLNRVVLMMMGYNGQYTDYSSPGWPDCAFPLPQTGAI